jgi:hypothetical protein
MSRKTSPVFTLVDTGPLVALLNRNDPAHHRATIAVGRLSATRLLTTWPCFTEAMYLLHQANGHAGQDALWLWLTDERVQLHDLTPAEQQRMRALMAKYADTPMDVADASLVAVAESLDLRRIFTLDDDFFVYRLADGSTLEVIR